MDRIRVGLCGGSTKKMVFFSGTKCLMVKTTHLCDYFGGHFKCVFRANVRPFFAVLRENSSLYIHQTKLRSFKMAPKKKTIGPVTCYLRTCYPKVFSGEDFRGAGEPKRAPARRCSPKTTRITNRSPKCSAGDGGPSDGAAHTVGLVLHVLLTPPSQVHKSSPFTSLGVKIYRPPPGGWGHLPHCGGERRRVGS